MIVPLLAGLPNHGGQHAVGKSGLNGPALGTAFMNDDLNSSEISADSSRFSFDA